MGETAKRMRSRVGWRCCLVLLALTCRSLFARAQSFTTRAIGQSSPVPSAVNTITLTLVADTNLPGPMQITLSGLTGAAAASSIELLEASSNGSIFSNATAFGQAAWSADGNLTLSISNGTVLLANRSYSFGFHVRNPTTSTTSTTVLVAASGAVTIPSQAMVKPGTHLYGVPRGRDPLTVAVPAFETMMIVQSTPVPDQDNVITLTLACNYDLPEGSRVTVSGLDHTQTPTNGSLPIASSPDGMFASTAGWNDNGTLTLTVASSRTVSHGQPVSVTFTLRNPRGETVSPTVNVQADIVVSGMRIAWVVQSAMKKSGESLYGVARGRDPLTVVIPSWQRRAIGQAWPLAGFRNTLTVSLQANYLLSPGSMVTISNLTGTQTTDTARLPVSPTPPLFASVGQWTKDLGQLVLTAAANISAGTECVVSFEVMNAQSSQTSPAVSVAANIVIATIPRQAMTKNQSALLGVYRGHEVLELVSPALTVSASNLHGLQGGSVTIGGSGLYHASSAQARLAFTACEATVWVSDTHAVCKGALGAVSTGKVMVTVGQGAAPGSLSEAVSFDGGSIAGMASGALNLAQLSSNRSALTISGAALGMVDMSARQRVGASACEVTVWGSDTRVSARASSGGVGSVRVVLSAGAARVASRTSLLSYDALLLVGAGRGSRNLVASVSRQVLALHSEPSAFATPRLRLASSSCQASNWLSDTTLACQMAAAGPSSTFARAFPLVITTGARVGSLTQVFSYDALQVSSADGNAAVVAARTISLTGSGFMSGHMSARARIRGTGTLGAQWVSDSRLACKIAFSSASTQASLSVSMGVGNRGTLSESFTFDAPRLIARVSNSPQSGRVGVSIVGINLGAHDPSGIARVGGTRCIQTLWHADTLIICHMPRAGRVETAIKDVVLSLPTHELQLSDAVFFDPVDRMLPGQGQVLVKMKLKLLLSRSVTSEVLVDSMVYALLSTFAPSGLSVSSNDVYVKVESGTVSSSRRKVPAPPPSETPQQQQAHLHLNSSAQARRQGASSNNVVEVETQVLKDQSLAQQLVSILGASVRDGSLLSALAGTALPVQALELKEEIGILSSNGVVEKCCCDPALCACYVCHEVKPSAFWGEISYVTAGVAAGVILVAGCFFSFHRSHKHDKVSASTSTAFAQLSPQDSKALERMKVRTEAKLSVRRAWE